MEFSKFRNSLKLPSRPSNRFFVNLSTNVSQNELLMAQLNTCIYITKVVIMSQRSPLSHPAILIMIRSLNPWRKTINVRVRFKCSIINNVVGVSLITGQNHVSSRKNPFCCENIIFETKKTKSKFRLRKRFTNWKFWIEKNMI